MERYDYRQAIMDDIRDYIRENDIRVTYDNRDDLEEELRDSLWTEDSVTGNASGSYTFNAWQAEEYLCHNYDLLCDAFREFGYEPMEKLDSPETADVIIRCYLLGECLSSVLDELEEDDIEDEDEEDDFGLKTEDDL
jgi:hypothetical protein